MSVQSKPEREETSNVVLVDGSNVAYAVEGEPPRVANLIAIRDKLREEGLEPIIVADAALRHSIDNPKTVRAVDRRRAGTPGSRRHGCRLFHSGVRARAEREYRLERPIPRSHQAISGSARAGDSIHDRSG